MSYKAFMTIQWNGHKYALKIGLGIMSVLIPLWEEWFLGAILGAISKLHFQIQQEMYKYEEVIEN